MSTSPEPAAAAANAAANAASPDDEQPHDVEMAAEDKKTTTTTADEETTAMDAVAAAIAAAAAAPPTLARQDTAFTAFVATASEVSAEILAEDQRLRTRTSTEPDARSPAPFHIPLLNVNVNVPLLFHVSSAGGEDAPPPPPTTTPSRPTTPHPRTTSENTAPPLREPTPSNASQLKSPTPSTHEHDHEHDHDHNHDHEQKQGDGDEQPPSTLTITPSTYAFDPATALPQGKPLAPPDESSAPPLHLAHAVPADAVVKLLNTNATSGLSAAAAEEILKLVGPNKLTEAPRETFLHKLYRQLAEVLVIILLIACIVSGALQMWPEFGLILAVVVINVGLGLFQEGRAQRATDALKAMMTETCTVVRDGVEFDVDATTLVPGDLVFIKTGDLVPADLRIVKSTNLSILEAALTGESVPVAKRIDAVAEKAPLAEMRCMAFSSTIVQTGKGYGVVVATGDLTEIGRLSTMVAQIKEKKTDLQLQVDRFGRWVGVIMIPIVIASFLLEYFTGKNPGNASQAFLVAVAIAVSIVPAGLPAILFITFALGQQKLATQHNTIVKTLPSVETLGSVMVICSDKTGTLTKNEMTVTFVQTSSARFSVTGAGYNPGVGNKVLDSENHVVSFAPPSASGDGDDDDATTTGSKLLWLSSKAVLCTDPSALVLKPSSAPDKPPTIVKVGNPTEAAINSFSYKVGLDPTRVRAETPRVAEIPFDSAYKFMATFHDDPTDADSLVCIVKGAPDRVLARCRGQLKFPSMEPEPLDADGWTSRLAELSSQGLRCLLVAVGKVPKSTPLDELERASFVLEDREGESSGKFLDAAVAFAIMDPPRDECYEAVRVARQAGVTVKMITGDHPTTALAIANKLQITDADHAGVVTGPEIDAMSDADLRATMLKVNVCARASPENKIRIVRALQAEKKVCAMTGDGVNDAPALRAADIGVGMGMAGTAAAREAAKIILKDDNFASIVAAVREGRRVYTNIRKIVIFNMPTNFGQGLTIFWALAFQLPTVPFTALQVLYVNLVTAVTLGLALALEPVEPVEMTLPPRRVGKQLVGRFFIWRCFFVTGVYLCFTLGAFRWTENLGFSDSATRAQAMTTIVMCECAYLLNCRFLLDTALSPRIFKGNVSVWVCIAVMVALQNFLVYTPGVNAFFGMAPLTGWQWGIAIMFGILTFFIIEAEKFLIVRVWRPILRPFFYAMANKASKPEVVFVRRGRRYPKQGGVMRWPAPLPRASKSSQGSAASASAPLQRQPSSAAAAAVGGDGGAARDANATQQSGGAGAVAAQQQQSVSRLAASSSSCFWFVCV